VLLTLISEEKADYAEQVEQQQASDKRDSKTVINNNASDDKERESKAIDNVIDKAIDKAKSRGSDGGGPKAVDVTSLCLAHVLSGTHAGFNFPEQVKCTSSTAESSSSDSKAVVVEIMFVAYSNTAKMITMHRSFTESN
jgi:hypothetical protein